MTDLRASIRLTARDEASRNDGGTGCCDFAQHDGVVVLRPDEAGHQRPKKNPGVFADEVQRQGAQWHRGDPAEGGGEHQGDKAIRDVQKKHSDDLAGTEAVVQVVVARNVISVTHGRIIP